jgi:hypothetical protein
MNAPYRPSAVLQNPGQTAASWSLGFGIVSWLCLPLIGAAFAVGFGYSSVNSSRRSGWPICGTAVAGIVLGGIQFGIAALLALGTIINAFRLSTGH